MIKIYHNPRCKKSREGLQYLKEKSVEFEVIDYISSPLAVEELKEILLKMNKKPAELVRKQEEYYKKELKGRNFTDEEWLRILVENPRLIRRPVIVGKYKAVIGQPVENIEKVIG